MSIPQNILATDRTTSLTDMSLEELMNVEVVSVSKRSEKMIDAPAAVYVLTGEEIKRLGARNIPDALKSVPGLHIASVDANTWAISSRGFNGSFSNKLLVLIDGRTVYNHLFSGVWWDVQDVVMDDIDRIEVIRGPGATMWGSNAVNGVINIITKHTEATEGGSFSIGSGTENRGFGAIKYGKDLGNNTSIRIYSKYFDRDKYSSPAGLTASDKWSQGRIGFRLDKSHNKSEILLKGEYYNGESNGSYFLPSVEEPYWNQYSAETEVQGGHIAANWSISYGKGNSLSIKSYYDYSERKDFYLANRIWTADIEFQHSFNLSNNTNFVWGAGYRNGRDDMSQGEFIRLNPDKYSYGLSNAFMQVDHAMIPNKLKITAGAKLEHNAFTKYEFQPNLRIFWNINDRNSFWTAASRAVRTPSRGEKQGTIFAGSLPPLSASNDSPIPVKIVFVGGEESNSESVVSWEMGYRSEISSSISMDVASFYCWYENLLAGEIGNPDLSAMPNYILLPIAVVNEIDLETYGVEFATNIQFLSNATIRASYSYILTELKNHIDNPLGENTRAFEAQAPKHQFNINAFYNPTNKLDFSARVRYVEEIPEINIERYITLDLRAAYKLSNNIELSISGQDLLESDRIEYVDEMLRNSTRVESKVYTQLKWTL